MNLTAPVWNPPSKSLDSRLRDCGITPTQQRVAIAEVLFARPQHLSADQILEKLNRSKPCVSKATVYNTLNLFVQKGLVREVIVDPTKVFYDPSIHAHHHFYNVDTGELQDFDADALKIGDIPAPPTGTLTEGVDVIVRVRNR